MKDRPDIPYPASLITPEWRIEEALRLRLAELGGAVEFGTALGSFEQSDEAVSAVVVKGGEAETVTARWLVGCDGGHSIVRKQAGIAFEGETREEVRMIVADVEVDGLDRDAWHMWRHEEGIVSLCPLPSTDVFQYQAGIAPGQDPELSLANMQAILERRSGRTDIRLHEPEWSSLWRANIRLVDRYREGRVFLAGDAAHIHSPAGGQGMNTGIQDAHNLGWKLAAVAKGAAPALLDSYEAERRPVAAGVLALSNARLKQAIEQKGIPTRRDASTMQLGVNYRGSALARDDRDETALLRAGDRAPDATGLTTVEGERRLFDLTRGGRFTLAELRGHDRRSKPPVRPQDSPCRRTTDRPRRHRRHRRPSCQGLRRSRPHPRADPSRRLHRADLRCRRRLGGVGLSRRDQLSRCRLAARPHGSEFRTPSHSSPHSVSVSEPSSLLCTQSYHGKKAMIAKRWAAEG